MDKFREHEYNVLEIATLLQCGISYNSYAITIIQYFAMGEIIQQTNLMPMQDVDPQN